MYIYLEPVSLSSILVASNPPKQGPNSNQNKGHLGSRYLGYQNSAPNGLFLVFFLFFFGGGGGSNFYDPWRIQVYIYNILMETMKSWIQSGGAKVSYEVFWGFLADAQINLDISTSTTDGSWWLLFIILIASRM